MQLDRRTLLAGMGATAILAAGGGAAYVSAKSPLPVSYARNVLDRLVGPYVLDDAGMQKLVDMTIAYMPRGALKPLIRVAEFGGLDPAHSGMMPESARHAADRFERHLLKEFVWRTTYLETGPTQPLDVIEEPACRSPYARIV